MRYPIALTLVCGLACPALLGGVKIEHEVVGPAPNRAMPSSHISPRGVHYATLTMKGSRAVVVIDGVEGPPIDELLDKRGQQSLTCVNAVVFSPDCEHSVYLARVGNDYIVVRDGKELTRGGFSSLAVSYGELSWSPGGRHLFYVEASPAPWGQVYKLVIDGKRGPATGHQTIEPVFSPDDSRWAYNARRPNVPREEWFSVVDGKEQAFLGRRLRFTADNRLISLLEIAGKEPPQVRVDGKMQMKLASFDDKIWTASKGSHYAVAGQLKAGQGNVLLLDGKPVSGARAPEDVVFSPDGKRWMASCRTPSALYIVTDGKPGQEYRNISGLAFTPDSSKAIYVVANGLKTFVVVNGVESDGFELLVGGRRPVATSLEGGHYAFATGDGMNQNFTVVIDGKTQPLNGRRVIGDTLRFTRDGKHYLYATRPAQRNDDARLVRDGREITGIAPSEFMQTPQEELSFAEFSPDGEHIVWRAVGGAEQRKVGLALDDKLVWSGANIVRRPTFTPDSRHVMWMTREFNPGTPPYFQVYVDGRPALKIAESFELVPASWGMRDDGALQLLAIDGDVVKRYRVSADGETNLATMAADYDAAEKAEIARVEKEKSDALAAAEKAKADAAEAAAKARADQQAAYAAKVKARQEAIEAKQKARADALAAKKKAAAEAAAKRKQGR